MYIVSYTKFVEITIYPWLDYVLYILLQSNSIVFRQQFFKDLDIINQF